MTPGDQARKIEAFIKGFPDLIANTFEVATRQLETDIHHRIFEEHLDTDGNKLGKYSNKPMLIGAKSFANQTEANKFFTQEKKEKTGQWRKVNGKSLFLLDGGYEELRLIQGRQVNEIDLQYTHELELSGIGVQIDDRYIVKFQNQTATKKGRGFEKKKGEKVFSASPDERKKALKFIKTKIVGGLKECFS